MRKFSATLSVTLFLALTSFSVSSAISSKSTASGRLSNARLVSVQDPVPGPRPVPLPRPGDTIRPTTGAIRGTITLVDCNAAPADVRVAAGGITAQPTTLEDNAFVWKYSIENVAAGTHTVVPTFMRTRCRGGVWSPATESRTVISGGAVSGVDFEYRGRRDTTRISTFLVASLIEAVFSGTAIHLNNFTNARHTVAGRDSWHRADDSSITRPASLGGGVTTFNLDEVSQGPLRYYLQDLNLSRIDVQPEADAFRLSFHFENVGPVEIKGKCSNTTSPIDPACAAGSDSTAPDFQLDNARVDVRLTPVREAGGGLTYGPVRVTFDANVRGRLLGSLEFIETLVKRSIKTSVEAQVTNLIDDPGLRRVVARQLRPALDRLGVGTVVAVRFEGRQLVMESYPR